MPKAILKNGRIQPVEPLPSEWTEGQELVIVSAKKTKKSKRSIKDIEATYRKIEKLAAQMDPEDERIRDEAIREVRRLAKEQARKEMGL